VKPRTTEKRSEDTLALARQIEEERGKIVLRRGTQEAIARRREHVWKFLMEGTPQTVMAELLQVSRRTISNDCAWVREEASKRLQAIKGNPDKIHAELAMSCGRLKACSDAAMAEYLLSNNPSNKDRFLNTAIRAEWIYVRLMAETGVLPRQGEEIRVRNETEVTFKARFGEDNPLAKLDNPVSARKVQAAVAKMLEAAAHEDGEDGFIEVEATVAETP